MGACFRVILAVVGLSVGRNKDTSGIGAVGVHYILTEQFLLGREAVFILFPCHCDDDMMRL